MKYFITRDVISFMKLFAILKTGEQNESSGLYYQNQNRQKPKT